MYCEKPTAEALDDALELARDGKNNILLAAAGRTDGTGILAAMARIDGDDDVALTHRGGNNAAHGFGTGGAAQFDHQTMALARLGLLHEAAHLGGRCQVQHQAQILALGAVAHLVDEPTGLAGKTTGQLAALDVDHHPVGIGQGEQLVVGPGGQMQHRLGALALDTVLHLLQFRGVHRRQRPAADQAGQQQVADNDGHDRGLYALPDSDATTFP